MYRNHQPKIQQHASGSPSGLLDVLVFVRLTIQRRIETVPALMDYWRRNGRLPRSCMEQERLFLLHARERIQGLHSLLFVERADTLTCLLHLAALPGLGLTKAGFVLQLVRGEAGCLDTHNLRRYGLPMRAFRIDGVSAAKLRQKAELYLALCRDLGGPEALWDTWCQHVSRLRPTIGTAWDVSRLHVRAIIGE